MKRIKLDTRILVAALPVLLAGCNSTTMGKLQTVGQQPPLSQVESPTSKPNYEPMSWPLPEMSASQPQTPNSLWQPGARAFFRDQRASRVGDIMRVKIKINDQAQLNNQTERKRDSSDKAAAPALYGLQKQIFGLLPGTANPAKLLDVSNLTDTKGTGTIRRQDIVDTQVAVTVTQVLPNGNLAISGKQEMLINYEVRDVSVSGVVRREDIGSDNTVDSTQVAEARIAYSGHGQLMDVQQPRWGDQVVDILAPF
jgi:flagellar L-ring protein precursor FlgH